MNRKTADDSEIMRAPFGELLVLPCSMLPVKPRRKTPEKELKAVESTLTKNRDNRVTGYAAVRTNLKRNSIIMTTKIYLTVTFQF